ncbi:T9SS type A sorting domain-containing protein [Chryseobacterium sp.]|uniref:T9SS type A sorting domain-containing protein n=1 Tax=Chryseobacterium sp. TaxID=1871047 RepID=UPI002897CC12|nr:T9SS type A sorting domain-containing protein [Chryseobacterium sp.]
MQNLKYLLLFVAVLCTAQTFNYHREWGTYLGGVNGGAYRLYEGNNNLVLEGSMQTDNISPVPSVAFYNQFITPNEQNFQFGVNSNNKNFYVSKITSNGTAVQSFGYRTSRVIHRDKDGNYFKIVDSGTPTAGAWLSTGVETGANYYNRLLEKYDANNNLLWRTYVPNMKIYFNYVNSEADCLITDNAGNIYIKGNTQWQNLGDIGTAYPNYNSYSNCFVVKLNPMGQKIWGTYIPSNDASKQLFCVFGNNLYLTTRCGSTAPITATPGAFQSYFGINAILNLSATTGALQWCTFYASPNGNYEDIKSIAAEEDGLYVLGSLNAFPVSNTNGYYASSGAYQMQQGGGSHWFLAKFGMQGQRIWGTYYGSPDADVEYGAVAYDSFTGNLDVKNDKILITHFQDGDNSVATPGAYLSSKPNDNGNRDIVFSMFDTDGNRIFTSYYGAFISNAGQQAVFVHGQFSKKSDAFYLYGLTTSQNGFTQNALQNSINTPSSSTFTSSPYTSFLAKFSVNPLLSTQESAKYNEVQLFDNPNNGSFSLKGSILAKEQCSFSIYDASGRMLVDETMKKAEIQYFNLNQTLSAGSYVLTLKNSKKEAVKKFKMIVK